MKAELFLEIWCIPDRKRVVKRRREIRIRLIEKAFLPTSGAFPFFFLLSYLFFAWCTYSSFKSIRILEGKRGRSDKAGRFRIVRARFRMSVKEKETFGVRFGSAQTSTLDTVVSEGRRSVIQTDSTFDYIQTASDRVASQVREVWNRPTDRHQF